MFSEHLRRDFYDQMSFTNMSILMVKDTLINLEEPVKKQGLTIQVRIFNIFLIKVVAI